MRNVASTTAIKPIVRCAIYTRKSTDEGLKDSEFNSLDAQRLACTKYIDIQAHEGWHLAEHNYDDGGFTGASTDRPALKRLLADIEAKLVDVIVVYKIDRLSRSLLDFLNMMRLFEKYNIAFVSVTQQFNTSTSIGRCMLNIMMTFAEYERETTRERTIDKIAASKKQGIWMGGMVPYGYDLIAKKLVVNQLEAEVVQLIFAEFIKTHSLKAIARMLRDKDIRNKVRITSSGKGNGGNYFSSPSIYNMLKNPVYIAKIPHQGELYDGQHEAIITTEIWHAARSIVASSNTRIRAAQTKRKVPAMLQGLLRCGGCNSSMTPSHTRKKNGKLYRYYVPSAHLKGSCNSCPIKQVSAPEIENIVLSQVQQILKSPEILVGAWQKANEASADKVSENKIREALSDAHSVWSELWPVEQQRLMRLMLEKVVVQQGAVEVRIRAEGIGSLLHGFGKAINGNRVNI